MVDVLFRDETIKAENIRGSWKTSVGK